MNYHVRRVLLWAGGSVWSLNVFCRVLRSHIVITLFEKKNIFRCHKKGFVWIRILQQPESDPGWAVSGSGSGFSDSWSETQVFCLPSECHAGQSMSLAGIHMWNVYPHADHACCIVPPPGFLWNFYFPLVMGLPCSGRIMVGGGGGEGRGSSCTYPPPPHTHAYSQLLPLLII